MQKQAAGRKANGHRPFLSVLPLDHAGKRSEAQRTDSYHTERPSQLRAPQTGAAPEAKQEMHPSRNEEIRHQAVSQENTTAQQTR